MTQALKVVHYINQFFAGKGGEEHAGLAPFKIDGSVGPGRLLESTSNGNIEVIGTVVCGDNYYVENSSALNSILELIREYEPEALIAGPAFAAGRYSEACSAVCQAVQENLGIPVITGLAPESPVLNTFRKDINILKTGKTAANMKNDLPEMGRILLKLGRGHTLEKSDQEKLYSKGLKDNIVCKENAAERAINMALAKFRGEKYHSEVSMISYETVKPASSLNKQDFRIALVTDGGLVLKGNPEGMPSGRSKRWCRINVDGLDELTSDLVEIRHFGYDNRYVIEDPNRLVPLDVLRKKEKSGELKLHPYIYSTAGVATAIEDAATFGKEIAAIIKKDGVDAVILTST